MLLRQGSMVTWGLDGTYHIWFGKYSWGAKGSVVKAVAAAFGLLQIDQIFQTSTIEETTHYDHTKLSAEDIVHGVCRELKNCEPINPSERTAQFIIARAHQSEPIMKTSIQTQRADILELGISLIIAESERVALWILGPPPIGGDDHPT